MVTWSAAALAIVVLTNNPVYRVLLILVALNFISARRRPGLSMRGLLGLLAASGAYAVLYNPLVSHSGLHRLATIPTAIPLIGGAITAESLAYGASVAIGVAAAALAVAPLMMVLDPTDLIQALPPALRSTGTALAAALNLVPAVARSFVRVREAETLRGGRKRRGPAAALAVLVPVALTTIEASITLAEAMEARAYGSGPRTRFREPRHGPGDTAIVAGAMVAAAGMLALRVLGAPTDWYPFPALSLPTVEPAGVGLCLLLAVPTLVPARSPA